MLKELVKLADLLDSSGKLNYANVIDILISRAQRKDDFLTEETDYDVLMGIKDPDPIDSMIPLHNNIMFDLESPIGEAITDFLYTAIRVADDGLGNGDMIRVSEMEYIAQLVLRVNAINGKVYPKIQKNPNAFSAMQFRDILFQAKKYVMNSYNPVGNVDKKEFNDIALSLYEIYEDQYIKNYIGLREY